METVVKNLSSNIEVLGKAIEEAHSTIHELYLLDKAGSRLSQGLQEFHSQFTVLCEQYHVFVTRLMHMSQPLSWLRQYQMKGMYYLGYCGSIEAYINDLKEDVRVCEELFGKFEKTCQKIEDEYKKLQDISDKNRHSATASGLRKVAGIAAAGLAGLGLVVMGPVGIATGMLVGAATVAASTGLAVAAKKSFNREDMFKSITTEIKTVRTKINRFRQSCFGSTAHTSIMLTLESIERKLGNRVGYGVLSSTLDTLWDQLAETHQDTLLVCQMMNSTKPERVRLFYNLYDKLSFY